VDERELAALDTEVAEGRAANRSEAVRRGIARLQRDQRYRGEEAILVELAQRGEAVYPEFAGVLDLPHPPPPDRTDARSPRYCRSDHRGRDHQRMEPIREKPQPAAGGSAKRPPGGVGRGDQ